LFLDEPEALAKNVQYVQKIVLGLKRGGLAIGAAHGYPPLHTSWRVRGLIGLGLAAGWLLLLDAVTGLFSSGRPGPLVGALGAVVAVGLVALPLAPSLMGIKLAALASACLFPSLALLRKDALRPAPPGQSPLIVAMMRFAAACVITAIGIAFIVGLLADQPFLLKIDTFIGIKPAKLIPVLAVAVIYSLALRADGRRTWKQALVGAKDRILRLGTQPILLWQLAVAILAFAVLAVLVMRAGNDPGVGVSGVELKIRGLLDRLLPARPRFQEFLVGHPALILSFVLAARGQRTWAFPLFLVGAIGQVSLLNTFCHLHTPLPTSLWRAGIGIGIGIVVALTLYFPLDRLFLRRLPPAAASPDVP
ncbi:MAG: hypothetical protein H7Z41_05975, partial [Cytophagales bacterium]|nr:hypothetical protein [Armatimonadota bacterium]